MPVMLVYGDSDMFRPEHIVEFYQLLGGGLRDAGWMRENMSKNRLGDSARSHPLRDVRLTSAGANRASLPQRRKRGEELGRAGAAGEVAGRRSSDLDDARVPERERGRHFEHGPPWSYELNVPDGSSRGTTTTFRHSTSARSATRSRSCLVRKQTAPLTSRNSKPNPLAARLTRLSQIGHHRAP